MRDLNKSGFTVTEFLITSFSLFAGLYFIFWTGFLGSGYTLAQHYLNEFTYCELRSQPILCWSDLKRKTNSIKFVEVTKLSKETSADSKTVNLVFNFQLPIPGLKKGIQNIQLSANSKVEKWQ